MADSSITYSYPKYECEEQSLFQINLEQYRHIKTHLFLQPTPPPPKKEKGKKSKDEPEPPIPTLPTNDYILLNINRLESNLQSLEAKDDKKMIMGTLTQDDLTTTTESGSGPTTTTLPNSHLFLNYKLNFTPKNKPSPNPSNGNTTNMELDFQPILVSWECPHLSTSNEFIEYMTKSIALLKNIYSEFASTTNSILTTIVKNVVNQTCSRDLKFLKWWECELPTPLVHPKKMTLKEHILPLLLGHLKRHLVYNQDLFDSLKNAFVEIIATYIRMRKVVAQIWEYVLPKTYVRDNGGNTVTASLFLSSRYELVGTCYGVLYLWDHTLNRCISAIYFGSLITGLRQASISHINGDSRVIVLCGSGLIVMQFGFDHFNNESTNDQAVRTTVHILIRYGLSYSSGFGEFESNTSSTSNGIYLDADISGNVLIALVKKFDRSENDKYLLILDMPDIGKLSGCKDAILRDNTFVFYTFTESASSSSSFNNYRIVEPPPYLLVLPNNAFRYDWFDFVLRNMMGDVQHTHNLVNVRAPAHVFFPHKENKKGKSIGVICIDLLDYYNNSIRLKRTVQFPVSNEGLSWTDKEEEIRNKGVNEGEWVEESARPPTEYVNYIGSSI